MVPYKTYFYDYDGEYLVSPDAYVPGKVLNAKAMGIEGAGLNQPLDLFVDNNNSVYIADTGSNRIIILDEQYRIKREITEFVHEDGVTKDQFNTPSGIFVSEEGLIYVADSKNARIVVLHQDGSVEKILEAPDSDVFPAALFTSHQQSVLIHPVLSMLFRRAQTWVLLL